jgi:hypothetical protein
LKMAQKYRRPLLAFYLDVPPPRGDRGEDFRSTTEKQTESESLVDALVRDVRARQQTVRDLLSDEDAPRLPFIASATIGDGIDSILGSIRQRIGLDVAAYRAQVSPESAFALLRSRVEAAGIFVLLIGNLGTDVDVKAVLVLVEEVDRAHVAHCTSAGYGTDLTDDQILQIGRDPFLIAYAMASSLLLQTRLLTRRPLGR